MTATARRGLIFSVIMLAIALRLFALDKSFQGDEFLSVLDARYLTEIIPRLMSDSHPPLYFYMLHFWMNLPWNESMLRILSVIPGVGVCVLAYLIGSMAADRRAGTIAAFLTAVAPVMVWSSQYIRTYAWAAFLSVSSVYFLMRVLKGERETFLNWACFTLVAAAGVYTFYFSALILAAGNVFVFVYMRHDREFLQRWLVSQAIVAALCFPWLPYFLYQRASYMGHPQMVGRVGFYIGSIHMGAIARGISGLAGLDPRFFVKSALSGNVLLRSVSVMLIGAAVALMAAIAVKAFGPLDMEDEKKRYLRLFLMLALLPFAMALVAHQVAGIVIMSHYFIASFVFLALSAAVVLSDAASQKARVVAIAAVAILCIFRLFFLYGDKGMDFRSAHEYIRSSVPDKAVLISPSRLALGGLVAFYFSDMGRVYYAEGSRIPKLRYDDIVVLSHEGKLELKGYNDSVTAFVKEGRYSPVESKRFGDLTMSYYRRSR